MQHQSQGLAKGPTAGTTGLLHHDAVISADEIARYVARGKQMQAEAIATLLTRAFRRLAGLVQRHPANQPTPAGHKPAAQHGA